MTDAQPVAAVPRAPRSTAWLFLLASAGAVGLTGIVATVLVLLQVSTTDLSAAPRAAAAFGVACLLTTASLGIRALRWVFLLRRAETRIPLHDAYVGYLAGFSLLFAPVFLGEIAVRAAVLRRRGGVPAATTVVVNVWERALDGVGLALLAGVVGVGMGRSGWTSWTLLAVALVSVVPQVRRAAVGVVARAARPLGGFDNSSALVRLSATRAWLVALSASVVAWMLPGLGLWGIVNALVPRGAGLSVAAAEHTYALASITGGLVLAPGGIVVTGGRLMAAFAEAELSASAVVLSTLGIRLATVGLSTSLGVVFLLMHLRTARAARAPHFDAIADAYDVQIPEARRAALLSKKTELMLAVLARVGAGRQGLDVGCGQGTYVARMRELGLDVRGIDASEGQVRLASGHVGEPGIVTVGSVLRIPRPDGSCDFVYVINVLHHLATVDEQRQAFAEMTRVLVPGGVLFVHEINTRNVLFRFYMGYVFPSLNCIDEGVERWLLPHRLASYTDRLEVKEVEYFTFLPDFLPAPLVRLLAPVERALEGSRARVFSAHYMAVLRKPV